MRTLAPFYARAPRAPWDGRMYRRALAADVERTAQELAAPALGLSSAAIDDVAAGLRQRIAELSGTLHGRIAMGRVVDAHGDLRPEHVFLTPEPQVIDCLEFSAELRLNDSAAELAFLALECERLGHPALAERLIGLYRHYCHDDVDAGLLDLYRRLHAFTRAKLAAWHLHGESPESASARWRERARWYLEVAGGAAPSRPSATRNGGGRGEPAT
jgi:aminoglycoside phosphotransferase family enzyme